MHPPRNRHLRAVIEVGFIIFLFYSNLLMGEFTRTAGVNKTFLAAIINIITVKNFAIAIVTSAVGHFALELLRERS